MREVDGVLDVHDLHVWTIASGMPVMSAHVVVEPADHAATEHHTHHRRGTVAELGGHR